MKTILLFLSTFLLFSFVGKEAALDKNEAQLAFNYLNKIRANPSAYKKELGNFVSSVKPKPILKWDANLAAAAEEKAMDMAKNNYFGHIDKKGYGMNYHINKAGYTLDASFLKNKKGNYFESIGYNQQSATQLINDLIIDKDVAGKGHRKHLLALDDFYAKCTDIGIGFAKIDRGKGYEETYISVLIAYHN
jgi:uncharacterized protein YkwD